MGLDEIMATQYANESLHSLFAGSTNSASVGCRLYSAVSCHLHEKCLFWRALWNLYYVEFEIFKAAITNSSLFWDIMLFSPVKIDGRFAEIYRLRFQRRKAVKQETNMKQAGIRALLPRNIGCVPLNYTALYPSRQNSSLLCTFFSTGCYDVMIGLWVRGASLPLIFLLLSSLSSKTHSI
jgi:hypothetical protein